MENSLLDLQELRDELSRLITLKEVKLQKAKTIKILSILCLCLLGYISMYILFFVLGSFMLSFKSFKKKSPMQLIGGFLCILPVVVVIIGAILQQTSYKYTHSDSYFDYYSTDWTQYYLGLSMSIIGSLTFYAGAVVSLVFISNEISKIENEYGNKIKDIKNQIRQIKIKNNDDKLIDESA